EESIGLCEQAGMNDLAVTVQAVYGRALLACGRLEEADAATASAAGALRPGIDQGHLVARARSEVLWALGDHDGADRYLEAAHRMLMEMLDDLDAGARDRAISDVPAHGRIVAEWERRRPRVERVRIAAAGAPGGRTLSDADQIEVAWTVATPADESIPDRIERRRAQLIRLVGEATDQGGAPTVEDLAAALRASSATIRRDLASLRSEGRPVETRGSRHSDSS
ncbi:MAG: DUF1670 domain-containing protein, partial [Acidimicrobiia bacterium]|nr:DUF1670 domain-containing protein [Acidimicrobiia bacterium]